jgi:hypothetical protein
MDMWLMALWLGCFWGLTCDFWAEFEELIFDVSVWLEC